VQPTTVPSGSPSMQAVDCMVGAWSSWATCSATCAGGTASRTRSVLRPTAGSGGLCPETLTVKPCNTDVCPVDCVTRVLSNP
jgi:complement component 6